MKIAWYALVLLAGLFTVATVRGLVVGDLIASGPVVDATVIGTQSSSQSRKHGGPITTYAPVLRMEYPAGTPVELRSATGWSTTPTFKEGDVMRVRVNAKSPELSALDTPFRNLGVPIIKVLVPLALWGLVLALRRFAR